MNGNFYKFKHQVALNFYVVDSTVNYANFIMEPYKMHLKSKIMQFNKLMQFKFRPMHLNMHLTIIKNAYKNKNC